MVSVNSMDSGETPRGFVGGGKGIVIWCHVFSSQLRVKHVFLVVSILIRCGLGFALMGLMGWGLICFVLVWGF